MKEVFSVKRFYALVVLFFMAAPLLLMSQNIDLQSVSVKTNYDLASDCFRNAYKMYPNVPRGLLEAVSFTNTHFSHLTDADYVNEEDEQEMPRSYGLMGLVANGKGVFRENLHLVSSLSGYEEAEILSDPAINVMAYAAAFAKVSSEKQCQTLNDYMAVVTELSELPNRREADKMPIDMMLYSVLHFMGNESMCGQFGIKKSDIDMEAIFGDKLEYLRAGKVVTLREEVDYPGAVWVPAASCNYESRSEAITAVILHDTEGSFAGSVSWFQNCSASSSSHYMIRSSDGYVVQLVKEADKAWHARDANRYSIGIEHEGYISNPAYYTDTMYKTSAALVKNICDRYDAIGSHYMFYRDTLDDGTALDSGLHELGGDNPSTGKSYCVRICGHQHLYNQTHTDPGPHWNWNYYYKLVNKDVTEVEVLEGMSGNFDNHTAKNYPNSERSLTLIRVPEGNIVELDFQSFALETNYDFMWIYDGDNEFAPLIGRYNTQSPGTVTSSSNVMMVEFRSDCNDNAAGWHAVWSAQSVTTDVYETACDSYEWHGHTYTESGEYTYHTTTSQGVDSYELLHLTINNSSAHSIYRDVCGGYEWNGHEYNTTGVYTQTMTNVSGCDSTVTLYLTVNQSVHNEIIVIGYDSYTWNDVIYTESGDYDQTFVTEHGCDSTVTMHLTLHLLPNITVTGDTLIYEGHHATLTAEGASNYQWSTGDTLVTITVWPQVTTTYYVQGFDEDGESVGYGSITVTVLPDGINDEKEEIIALRPNPASQTITVEMPSAAEASVVIYDMCGKVVIATNASGKSINIDVSGLRQGVYFVRCNISDKHLPVEKFIKM